MPCYLYIDGKKQEMDENIFDQMAEALHQPTTPKNTPTANSRWKQPEALLTTSRSRYKPDGTYDKRPLDEDYFKIYYQKKLKIPFKCPDCGRTISSKSNLSKHRQTNVCMSNRRHWWKMNNLLNNINFCWECLHVEVQPKSPKPEPQTPAQKLLKDLPPYRVRSIWQRIQD